MAQRSPYNDRYKVDQKGKTRKSASAAKPKRALADLTPAQAAKKSQKKPSLWSRAKSSGSGSGASAAAARIESTPRMKQLRRVWWMLWSGALAMAVLILVLQQLKFTNPIVNGLLWLLWLVAMGGAFYIEFIPIRKERAMAVEALKPAPKASKPEKPAKPVKAAKPSGIVEVPAPDDSEPPTQDGSE
jgi:cation transport ATPase